MNPIYKNTGEVTFRYPEAMLSLKHDFFVNMINIVIHDYLNRTFPIQLSDFRIIADPSMVCFLEASEKFWVNSPQSFTTEIIMDKDGNTLVGKLDGVDIYRQMFATSSFIEIQNNMGTLVTVFRINFIKPCKVDMT